MLILSNDVRLIVVYAYTITNEGLKNSVLTYAKLIARKCPPKEHIIFLN